MRKIFSSKTHWFVALLLAAALVFGFASCSSDSDDDDDDSSSSSSSSSASLSAWLPDEFSSKSVDALYTTTYSESGESEVVSGVQAYYFFTDKTFVRTTVVLTVIGGESEKHYDLGYKGSFSISGNYTNGTLTLNKTHQAKNNIWTEENESNWRTFTVANGSFIWKEDTFTKQ